ncbi:MAG: methyltransferase domain-containing protein [Clostridia bacterium]|nr:methyltransferase domain-containing protein [Clostridia bacterium]
MNTEKFTGIAEDYTVGRPSYADSFIDYLFTELGFTSETIIADIGCGTGKLTKQILDRGSFVYGVEPNEDMRSVAVKELIKYEKFTSVKGDASNTSLQDRSVDFVTAAQAFHWFNIYEFRSECKRIIKDNGKVILIWNSRDESDEVNKAIYTMNKKFCPNFKGFSGGIKKDDERIIEFFSGEYERLRFDNPLYYNKDTFISRCLSSSYSLKQGDKNYDEYISYAKCIFDKYSIDGILKIGNNTVAYIGNA